jgi:hypothetical protein
MRLNRTTPAEYKTNRHIPWTILDRSRDTGLSSKLSPHVHTHTQSNDAGKGPRLSRILLHVALSNEFIKPGNLSFGSVADLRPDVGARNRDVQCTPFTVTGGTAGALD